MNFKTSKNRQRSIRIVEAKSTTYVSLILMLCFTLCINAQNTPEPPATPNAISITTSNSSYSISVDTDDKKQNSSVSISVSDESYKFRATYNNSNNAGVKAMLLNELGEQFLTKKGNTYVWANGVVFECKLSNGSLRMRVDSDLASDAFLKKIKALGNDLKYFVSGTNKKEEEAKTAARLKRELERAEIEVARAKRELARAEREAKNAARY